MPPRRRAAATAAAPPADPPLDGCAIAISGKFDSISHNHSSLETLVRKYGGTVTRSVTKATTHVVCTEDDFNNGTTKIAAGKAKDLPVVGPQWLLDVDEQSKKLDADDYAWKDKQANGTKGTSKKRPAKADKVEEDEEEEEEEEEEQPKTKKAKATKGTKAAAPKAAAPKAAAPKAATSKAAKSAKAKADVKDEPEEPVKKAEKVVAEGQFMKKKGITIPIDEYCPYSNWAVHVDPDSGLIFDVALNQTNASNNNNKFYRLQLQRNGQQYHTWTRWGRVGESGANAVVGAGDLKGAMKAFEKKFKDKTGLTWENRGDNPKPGKYAFVERSYDSDSDDEDDDDVKPVKKEGDEDEPPAPECTLEKPIQDLMQLIFNQQYFQATMSALNYDANKLPLGKLSKATITRGFQQLKDLSALFTDPSLAASKYGTTLGNAVENISNAYYSLVPHDFGRQRPPVIRDDNFLKKEVELLESLGNMKDASEVMKIDRKTQDSVHQLDRQFQGLGLEEMTNLDPESNEFTELAKYLHESRGSTHHVNYHIQNIFRIERQGEKDRFDNSLFAQIKSDRRLLWHGSRCTNFGGILSQGLRIAPPEAPSTGYMFGKGIYLADMSSKSAGYCASSISNGHALLLLCEAELGEIQPLIHANYNAGDDAKRNGQHSTWGQGRTGPSQWTDASIAHKGLKGIKMPDTNVKPGPTNVPGAGLYYNEYIAYDIAQVKLRYLFRVKM